MNSDSEDVPEVFTPEEDMAMWRFAMDDHPGYDRHELWKLFVEKTGSKRDPAAFHDRFWNHLIPHLKEIKLHTETKLQMCIQHKIPLGDEFLHELGKDAFVMLGLERDVWRYTMDEHVRPNLDKELDDEAFLEATKIEEPAPFTEKDDETMWKYAEERRMSSISSNDSMWRLFKKDTGSEHTTFQLRRRFRDHLLPRLRHMDLPIEEKLSLCRYYKTEVDDDFLKELEKEAHVTMRCRTVEKFRMKEPFELVVLTSPSGRWYTPKEDQEIWNYVMENFEKEKNSEMTVAFWGDLVMKNRTRRAEAYLLRFRRLKQDLHKLKMDIETKLKLFKWSKTRVDSDTLKTLREHANVSVRSNGWICSYKMLVPGRVESNSEEVHGAPQVEETNLLDEEDVEEPMDLGSAHSQMTSADSEKTPEDVPSGQCGTLAEALDRIVNNTASYHESYDPMILENVSTGDVEKSMIELQGIEENEDLDENYNPFPNIF